MLRLTTICSLLTASSAVHEQQSFSRASHEVSRSESVLSGRFLHLTDFHPDWFYRQEAKLNDFCHFDPEKLSLDFESNLSVQRTKKDHKEARAGYWGPPPGTECDTSIQLVNATFEYIRRELVGKKGGLDFVIWTGDNARHDNDNRYPRTLKQIYASNEFMVDKMQEIFGTDKYSDDFIPVVPTVGNNDVYPHNIMYAGPSSRTISAYKSMWKAWVPPEQSHTFDRGAYFHMPVGPKLSVVSLNSLYFYENNKAVDGCSTKDEPGSLQLDWLEIQLKLFRQQDVKIWIIGHIPPTERQWYDGCYDRYAALMIEYRDLIIGQLFGHVNIDHFYFMKHPLAVAADRRMASESDDVHILKNPLDVLTEARENFDALPAFPTQGQEKSGVDIDAFLGYLAVVNVAPSVVPNYYPTLRVYEYLTGDDRSNQMTPNEDVVDTQKKKKKKKKKKPKIPPVDKLGPGYTLQRYTPTKYEQLYLNLTIANDDPMTERLDYILEYDTSLPPYSMSDLTVASWVSLGKEISGLDGRGKLSEDDFMGDPILSTASSLASGSDDFQGDDLEVAKKKKKKKKKTKRNDGFWSVFVFRGFVSTGLEQTYHDEA